MATSRNRTLLSLFVFLGVLVWHVVAAAVQGETGVPVDSLTPHAIEEQLQVRQSRQLREGSTLMPSSAHTCPGLPTGPGPQPAQAPRGPYDVICYFSDLCVFLPWQPRRERPARHPLHLGPPKLPPCTMPPQHRPVLALRHGGVCRWGLAR